MAQHDAESGITQVGSNEATEVQPEDTTEAQSQDTTENNLLSLLAINKISEWKSTLSGALDDQRLFCALFVLITFNIIFILVNVTHNDSEKDEDGIRESCECNPNHRFFYVIWFSICCFLWVVCHFIVLIGESKDYLVRVWKSNDYLARVWDCNCSGIYGFWEHVNCSKKIRLSVPNSSSIYDRLKHYIFDKEQLSRYEFHLWTQYCELYVVGITKNTENFSIGRVEKIIEETFHKSPKSQQNDEVVHDSTTAVPKYHEKSNLRYKLQAAFFIVLKCVQFIAQLAIVPLLIMQMLDTYTFICFTANSYCSTRAEYNLHLDKTAFTFGFYGALMTSLLTTLMLQWLPWPEKPNKKSDDTESKL